MYFFCNEQNVTRPSKSHGEDIICTYLNLVKIQRIKFIANRKLTSCYLFIKILIRLWEKIYVLHDRGPFVCLEGK